MKRSRDRLCKNEWKVYKLTPLHANINFKSAQLISHQTCCLAKMRQFHGIMRTQERDGERNRAKKKFNNSEKFASHREDEHTKSICMKSSLLRFQDCLKLKFRFNTKPNQESRTQLNLDEDLIKQPNLSFTSHLHSPRKLYLPFRSQRNKLFGSVCSVN